MAKRDVSLSDLRQQFSYDADTGEFTRLLDQHGRPVSRRVGSVHRTGYIVLYALGRERSRARLAWFYVHGEWPKGEIDHINGNRQDDRIANLRDVDRSTNMQNLHAAKKNNVAGYLGVRKAHKSHLWQARIKANGAERSLGLFDTPQSAHEAYLQAKRQLHAGCTI